MKILDTGIIVINRLIPTSNIRHPKFLLNDVKLLAVF